MVWTQILLLFTFLIFYLKLLISQNKEFGASKFTLRSQWFEINIDFEISRVDCVMQLIISKSLFYSQEVLVSDGMLQKQT